jgi:DNA-binding transcriptional LysR family regulator
MLKLEHLRVFATVAETRALNDAAERLGRTSSAVSMTLKLIEATLDGDLFEGERKVTLTPLGRHVLQHARRAISEFEVATSEIGSFARGEEGEVRIAAVPSAATRLLPSAFARLHRSRPNVRVVLRDMDSSAVVQAVEQKSVDIGIASPTSSSAALSERLLLEDPFALLCRKDHPIAHLGRAATWQDIKPAEFIANGLCLNIPARELEQLVKSASLMVYNTSSLLAFVSEGFGITLLPALAIPANAENLQAVELAQPRPSRRLATMSRPNETLSPAAGALIGEIVTAAEALQQDT